MNTKVRNRVQGMKSTPKHDKEMKEEMQKVKKTDNSSNRPIVIIQRATTKCRQTRKERKISLQQDVDKLKRKLRHEENVHRALERAFTRPLGALPRLPPYLPSHTLELLAEVAVLEEEVVRLEEQIVSYRQGLYHEAIYISSSKKTKENGSDIGTDNPLSSIWCSSDSAQNQCASNRSDNRKQTFKKLNSSIAFGEDRQGKENQLNSNFTKYNKQAWINRVTETKLGLDFKQAGQAEYRMSDKVKSETTFRSISGEAALQDSGAANKVSEDLLKCLMNIFLRMSSMMNRDGDIESCQSYSESSGSSEETDSQDPYDIYAEFGKRDIGRYKHFRAIELKPTCSDLLVSSTFLMRRLKLLLRKLASVSLSRLTHQQKLAFWINVYNSCMLNAYLELGIPSTPEMIVALMPKAMINVGGLLLSAMTIEHFILRLPHQSKYILAKGPKCDEIVTKGIFGLEWPEPLVTFALSCGSWSSPAVRIYTAEHIENELEIAKRDYLQASVGIASPDKLAIPKLLDWYLHDFAKNVESLVDWVCTQLPTQLQNEALNCLHTSRANSIPQPIHVLPYEFRFRYLMAL